jgi:phosphatidylcholine synthase
VHAYTALGLIVAAAMAVLIVDGSAASLRRAFLLMLVACLIDATDGTLARLVRIKQTLPQFDGARLDDIIDFQTYTSLPLLLIWRAELLPDGWNWCLLAPLVASAYGFCQASAKTDDGYFLGFPSYWNLVALYLYYLDLPGRFAVGMLLFFAGMTFVPLRYLYPSMRGRLNFVSCVLAVPWVALLAYTLSVEITHPDDRTRLKQLIVASLYYPAYYLLVSWRISLRMWMERRGTATDTE